MALSTQGNRFYPSLPEITSDSVTHTNALQQIKSALQTHERRDNNYLKSFIRFEELVELGIIDEQGEFVLTINGLADVENTLAELNDTDLTDQSQGDLLYNANGTEWRDTNGALVWDPINDYLQLGANHSINWLSQSGDSFDFAALDQVAVTESSDWGNSHLDWTFVGVTHGEAALESTGVAQDTVSGIDVIDVSPDGLHCVVGNNSVDNIRTYTLASPYDFSNATSDGAAHPVTNPGRTVQFIDNGASVMVFRSSADDLAVYTLSSPYTITGTLGAPSAAVSGVTFGFNSGANVAYWMSRDGTRLIACSDVPGGFDAYRSFTLSIPYDITSHVFVEQLQMDNMPNGPESNGFDFKFAEDGLTVIHMEDSDAWWGSLTTPFDLSTLTWSANNPLDIQLDTSTQSFNLLVIPQDGNALYMTRTTSGGPRIAEYTKTVQNQPFFDSEFFVGNASFGTMVRGSSINFFNAYSFPTSDGSAGQFLGTDGSGQLVFSDASFDFDDTDFVHITGFETILGTKQFNAGVLMNSILTMQNANPIRWSSVSGDIEFLDFTLSGDPEFVAVQLLMLAEGADGSTVFTDSSLNNNMSSFTGNAEISDSQSRFGDTAMSFDGTGDSVVMPYLASYETGGSDFTIEYSVYHNSSVAGMGTHLNRWDIQAGSTDAVWFVWNDGGVLEFFYSTDGASFVTLSAAGFFTGEEDAWVDVAISRQGEDLFLLKNGVHHTTWDVGSDVFFSDSIWPIRIGAAYNTQSFGLDGFIDNVRFTVGAGRYDTTSYTVVDFSVTAVEQFVVGDPTFPTQIDGTLTTITGDAQVDGELTVTGLATLNDGVSVVGDISVSGLVDGRDIATDGTAQDTHIADGTIHFTEASIDHANILNIGTNTHAQIDTHIADGTIHFTQAAISITASQISDFSDAVETEVIVTATTSELEDITDAINTDAAKIAGYMVFNTTTGAPVWAVGDADGDTWDDATGTTVHTPV